MLYYIRNLILYEFQYLEVWLNEKNLMYLTDCINDADIMRL